MADYQKIVEDAEEKLKVLNEIKDVTGLVEDIEKFLARVKTRLTNVETKKRKKEEVGQRY